MTVGPLSFARHTAGPVRDSTKVQAGRQGAPSPVTPCPFNNGSAGCWRLARAEQHSQQYSAPEAVLEHERYPASNPTALAALKCIKGWLDFRLRDRHADRPDSAVPEARRALGSRLATSGRGTVGLGAATEALRASGMAGAEPSLFARQPRARLRRLGHRRSTHTWGRARADRAGVRRRPWHRVCLCSAAS
jgi:hypothetical protein